MSWVLVVFGFVVLVVLHELGHFTAAKLVGMRVEKFSLFFPPTLISKKRGETEYAIGLIPAGGYVKISGMNPDEDLPEEVRDRAYHAQPVWKRIVVIAAGPAVNLVLALALLFVFFFVIGADGPVTSRVSSIDKTYPAAKVLKSGDKLISVDGVRGGPQKLSPLIAKHKCAGSSHAKGCRATTPAKLVVLRDGKRLRIASKPIYDPLTKRTRLGFGFAPGPRETLSAGRSLDVSLTDFWFVTKQTVALPARLFNTEKRREISGVVGVSAVANKTINSNIADAVSLLALVSLSLAIVNLFPFLPLDGGHIFWATVEKVRGRAVPLAVMERAGVVGFMLVIALFLLGLSNDITRLTGEGFQVR